MPPAIKGMGAHEPAALKDLLRRFRLAAGLSQEALAERAHLSARAISDLERGVKRWPRPETLQLLALALNLSPQERETLARAARRPSGPRIPSESRHAQAGEPSRPATWPGNLPAQATSFIGRAREQAEVRALLEAHHLVTIAGSGGAGKTRLALQVAGTLATSYPDGVWQVELAGLADASLVPHAVASVLGLRAQSEATLPHAIAERLNVGKVLLLLDNCEHLIAACVELITVLLHSCRHLHVLATSREGLRVPGEAIYRVPPLSLPEADQVAHPEQLLTFEAIQLFVERAQERRLDFALTGATAAAVVQICRRLDGIPLAIELAAARIGVLTADGIAERLDDAFRLLTSGPRAVQPRHQTLRAALDWSHNLLSERERMLLRRLSVFVGGWTLEAAEAVCAGDLSAAPCSAPASSLRERPALAQAAQAAPSIPPHGLPSLHVEGAPDEPPHPAATVTGGAVLDLLDELVNKSLVLMDDMGRTAWYRLLETVRQYEHEHLEAAGEALPIRDRHLDWYVTLAAQAEPGLAGAEQDDWLSRLEREHDNLRAALAWSLRAPDRQGAGMELAASLKLFWEVHGHLTEARRWLEALLAHGTTARPAARARALQCAGALAVSQSDYARAALLLEDSLALQRQLGDQQGVAVVLQALGVVALYQGDVGRATALFEESLALRRQIGDHWGIAAALGNLGQAIFLQGDLERAILLHQESLSLRRQLGNKRGIAVSLNELGMIAWSRGDHVQAAALYEESLALRRALGDKGGVAVSLVNLAEVVIAQGANDRARVLLEESVPLSQELGDQQVMACCMEGLAAVAVADHAPRRAALLLGAAEALRESIGLPLPPPARAGYNRTIATVRTALGEASFSAAWSQGRALSLEQALAMARVPTARAGDPGASPAADTPAHSPTSS